MFIRQCLLCFPRGINLKENATSLNKIPCPGRLVLQGIHFLRVRAGIVGEGTGTAELCWEKVTLCIKGDGANHCCHPYSSLMGALLVLYPSGPSTDKNHSCFLWNPEEKDLTMPRIIFGKYQTCACHSLLYLFISFF